MKVVLDTKSGSTYDDVVASRYHFPSRYLAAIQGATGDWAVFRRPRDGGEGIAYFGVGRIENIVPDDACSGFFYALIKDYLPFATSVPWKPDGRYAERALREIENVSQVGIHLRGRSVRPLEDADFVALVNKGLSEVNDPQNFRRYWDTDTQAGAIFADPVRHATEQLTSRVLRDATFRKVVCEAYEDRCAVTRLKIVNGGGRAEVQAAHIRPVADDGPDIVQNGIALSATAHWLFDRHLISIDPEYRLLMSHNRIPDKLRGLLKGARTRLHLPADERLWPNDRFLSFHREHFGAGSS